MERETRKFFAEPSIKVTATCVRVPTMVGHGEALNVEFHKPLTPVKARQLLKKHPVSSSSTIRLNSCIPRP